MKTKFIVEPGENYAHFPKEPIISITGTGNNTYLWIGNDAESDKHCFGTLSGEKALRIFASNILKALDAD